MSPQPDMFDNTAISGIVGLKVLLDRPADREKPCHNNVCVIGGGKELHAHVLICAACGKRRSWLSKTTAQWIEYVVTRFGAPTTPIILREQHSKISELPAVDGADAGR